ncbi:hypothetical protein D3C76_1746280 [compost metagenome]
MHAETEHRIVTSHQRLELADFVCTELVAAGGLHLTLAEGRRVSHQAPATFEASNRLDLAGKESRQRRLRHAQEIVAR